VLQTTTLRPSEATKASGGPSDEVVPTHGVGVVDNHDELEITAASIKDYNNGG